jgi:hypothetical protein
VTRAGPVPGDAWSGACALGERVLQAQPVSSRFADHGSDVWRITTPTRILCARRSTLCGKPDTPFFHALRRVFGVNPRRTRDLAALHEAVARWTVLPVPQVLGFSCAATTLPPDPDREARYGEVAWVEWLPGEPLPAFVGAPATVLRSLASHLADLHSAAASGFGSPTRRALSPLERLHPQLVHTGDELLRIHFAGDAVAEATWVPARQCLLQLPAPACAGLILPDIDASQYLVRDGELSALVDLEAVVWGPPAWDFINLEYLLDQTGADILRAEYERRQPLPDLHDLRPAYRTFLRLCGAHGDMAWDTALHWPTYF